MKALVGTHFAVVRCAVKSNAMLIRDYVVISSVHNKDWTGVRADDCQVVEWVQNKKARNKEMRCTGLYTGKCGQKNERGR